MEINENDAETTKSSPIQQQQYMFTEEALPDEHARPTLNLVYVVLTDSSLLVYCRKT